jgi:hypothetical protein
MQSAGLSAVFAALAPLLGASPPGMYLPPSETGGTEFQFNPASAELRQAVKKPEPKRGDLLDARALADDLAFFRQALRKQYIGYPELLQLPDFDVEALFDQQIARLRAGPARVTFGDSALALFNELKNHINDSHFYMSGAGDPRGKYTEYQATITGPAPSLAGCTAPKASPTTLRVVPVLAADGTVGQLLTMSARPQGETLELTCGQQRFALKARPAAAREDRIFDKPVYEWRRAGKVAIIRIRRFSGTPADRALLEKLAADYPDHRRSPLIVFDLRGNGGGDDGYAYRWLKQARRGVWDSGSAAVYPVGSFIPWLMWNQEVWASIAQDRVDDPASVTKRDELRKQWPRSAAELSVEFKPARDESDAKAPYRGRVFVLIDRQCGSSGESAAHMLREGLKATLVGERTAGLREYGNVRMLVLPRTQLVSQFATKRNYFATPIEAVGTPADVYLPPELMQKPVEELIPLLRKLPPPKAS